MSNESRAPLPAWALRGLAVLVIGGATFYLWLCSTDPERWGQRGDALAPLAALLNAGALLALLHSLNLQRKELRAQRKELRAQRKELRLQRLELTANREEMKAQREEFAQTAKAQKLLAEATVQLGTAQTLANKLALEQLELQKDALRQQAEQTAALKEQDEHAVLISLLELISARRLRALENYSRNPNAKQMLPHFQEHEIRLLKKLEQKLGPQPGMSISDLIQKGPVI